MESLTQLMLPDIEEVTAYQEIEDAFKRIIELLGHDLTDPNIKETPKRVAKAYLNEWFKGYTMDPAKVLKVFPNTGNERDLVVVKDIPFYSTCAHHFAPFFGKAYIAYIPDQKVLGLSKFARLLDIYTRRLQLQERITGQMADALEQHLMPQGAMVVLKNVTHMCMTSRGVGAHGSETTTSAVRGIFATDAAIRSEALSLMGL